MSDFSLKAVFGMDGAGFRADLRQTMNEARTAVNDWGKIVTGVGVGALVALSKGAIDLASHLSDTSQNLGINVESLQALEAQHKRNGVSSEELAKGLAKVRAAGIAAFDGDQKQVGALAALGINARAFIQLPLDKQYAAIGRALNGASDANVAYNAVTQIFGEKIGPRMMESLRELGELGLPKVTEEARKAGQVLSAETIVALDRAGDAIDDFKKKATVAMGNILVNFRSADGLQLLALQFIRVGAIFMAKVTEAIGEAGELVWAVLSGAFINVANKFRDSMIDSIVGVATLVNKILPKTFEIDVGKLKELKSAGEDIAITIARAISETGPSTLVKDVTKYWDKVVADQQKVVDQLNKVDLGKDAGKLTNASNKFVTSAAAAATAVVGAGVKAADKITTAFQGGIGRKGRDPETLSPVQLDALLQNVKKNLAQQRSSDSSIYEFAGAGTPYKSPQQILLENELARIQQEQTLRQKFASDTRSFGSGFTERNYSATDFDRLKNLAGLVPAQEQTNQKLDKLTTLIGERIPPKAFDTSQDKILLGVQENIRSLNGRG